MNQSKKGIAIIVLISVGIAAGFFGWIESEYGTVHHENVMMWIGIAGGVIALAGFGWLWNSSGGK